MALPKLSGTPHPLSHPPAPSPCAPQSDGAGRLECPVWLLLVSSGLAVGLLAGCAPHPSTQLSPPTTQRQLAATAPAWNAVFQKWWQAATKPHSAALAQQAPKPVVYINVAVIAAHHPAWRLADALEHGGSSATALAALRSPAAVAELRRQTAPVPFGPLTVGAPGGVPGFYRAAKTVTARDLVSLQSIAYQRQEAALRDFIVDAAAYQAQSRAAQAQTLKTALAEDIEVAQRLNLAALTPTLPSDPIQLEMTNLRLALLKNLYATPGEKEQARQRLSALEAQWEAKLRSQEEQRLAELARLRQERPQRLRQAGETNINKTLSAAAQRDTAAREAILRAHNTLLAADFTPDTRRLGLVLPAATLPSQRLAGLMLSPTSRQPAPPPKSFETFHVKLTSRDTNERQAIGHWPSAARSGAQPGNRRISQAATIQALRAQAWQDARRWADIAARRGGWTWHEAAGQQRHQVWPDRTQAALRLLNLS